MKKILTTLTIVLMSCSIALAQSAKITVSNTDSSGNKKAAQTVVQQKKVATTTSYTPSYTDTDEEGITVESTVIDSVNDDYGNGVADLTKGLNIDSSFLKDIGATASAGISLAFFSIAVVFAFPLIIILLAFYFRYRNRRERYRLVEKALESGQPLPEGILKDKLDTQNKGIKNMCTGLGLFIFLWAITGSFGVGCIGILVFFNGVGQYLVARKNSSNNNNE